jgi:hypothetical protein
MRLIHVDTPKPTTRTYNRPELKSPGTVHRLTKNSQIGRDGEEFDLTMVWGSLDGNFTNKQ